MIDLLKDKVIELGGQGENLATTIQIDLAPAVAQYGQGSAVIIYQASPDHAPEIVIAEREGDVLTWIPTAAQLQVAGYGRCEIRWYVGDVIAKSYQKATHVVNTITGEGQEPEELPTWLDTLAELVATSTENVTIAARGAATATQKASEAAQSASDADEAKDDAVEASTEAKNAAVSAKTDADQAHASAVAAAGSASSASNSASSASGAANSAITAKNEAVNAQNQAKTSETNAGKSAQDAQQARTGAEQAQQKTVEEKTDALQKIGQARTEAIGAVNQKKEQSIAEIEDAERDALAEIAEDANVQRIAQLEDGYEIYINRIADTKNAKGEDVVKVMAYFHLPDGMTCIESGLILSKDGTYSDSYFSKWDEVFTLENADGTHVVKYHSSTSGKSYGTITMNIAVPDPSYWAYARAFVTYEVGGIVRTMYSSLCSGRLGDGLGGNDKVKEDLTATRDNLTNLAESVDERFNNIDEVIIETVQPLTEQVEDLETEILKKADADGYHPDLYAGNLTTDEGDGIEGTFVYRTTADGAEIADGKAQLQKITGNSRRLNQLWKRKSTSSSNGITQTNHADGTFTLDGTSTGAYFINFEPLSNDLEGHVFFMTARGYVPEGSYMTIEGSGYVNHNNYDQGSIFTIKRITKDHIPCYIYIHQVGVTFENVTYKPSMVDLTVLYNGNNNIPSEICTLNADGTVKSYDVNAFLEQNPEYKTYVPYNPGSIEGVKPKELKNSDANLFRNSRYHVDDDKRYYFEKIGKNSLLLRSISYAENYNSFVIRDSSIPHLFSFDFEIVEKKYDDVLLCVYANGSSLGTAVRYSFHGYSGHRDFIIPAGSHNVSFGGWGWNGVIKLTNIQMIDGNVYQDMGEPQENTVPIPIAKYFPNGMHRIGDVYDEIDFVNKKAINRVYKMDMLNNTGIGCTLSECNESNVRISLQTGTTAPLKNVGGSTIEYMFVPSKYAGSNARFEGVWNEGSNGTFTLRINRSRLNLAEDIYDSATIRDAFVRWLQEEEQRRYINLVYAEPIETPIDDADIPELYNVWNHGTEEFIYEEGDYPTEVPATIFYQQNLKKQIVDIPKNYYNKAEVDEKVKDLQDMIDDGAMDTFVGITGEKTSYYDFVGIKENPKLRVHLKGQSLRNYAYLPNSFSITQNGITLSYDASTQEFTANGTSTKVFNMFLPINLNLNDFAVGDEMMFMRYFTSGTANLNGGYLGYLVLEGGNAGTDGSGTIGTVSHRINENSESLYDPYISNASSKKATGTAQLVFQIYAIGMTLTNFKFKLGLFAGNELQGWIKGDSQATKSQVNVYDNSINIIGSHRYTSNTLNGITYENIDVNRKRLYGTATADTLLRLTGYTVCESNTKLLRIGLEEVEATLPSGKELSFATTYDSEGTYSEFYSKYNLVNFEQNDLFAGSSKYSIGTTGTQILVACIVPRGSVIDITLNILVSEDLNDYGFVPYKHTLLKSYNIGSGETAEFEFEGSEYGVLSIETSGDTLPPLYARSASDGHRSYIEYDSQASSPNQAISDLKQRISYMDSPFHDKIIGIWGDSRESNNPDSNPEGGGDQRNTSWPALLAQTLGCTVMNYGVSGGCLAENTYQQAKEQAIVNRINTDDPNKSCDIIVISSMNDFKLGTPLGEASVTNRNAATYYGALNLTIERAQAKYPKKKILFVIPQKRFDENVNYGTQHGVTQAQAGSYAAYRQAQILVCHWHGIKYVDLYTEFPGSPKYISGTTLSDAYKLYYLNDTHFSAVGNQFVADLVGRALAVDSTAGTDFMALPALPRAAGTYRLTLTMDSNMIPTLTWTT